MRSVPEAPESRPAIARAFGRAAAYYDERAEVQRRAADRLIELVHSHIGRAPEGPVLEVGCGTGFLSRRLARLFPERQLEITDLSDEMVNYCRRAVGPGAGERASFRVLDAERVPTPAGPAHAVIVAGFVAQWFADPAGSLVRLARSLRSDGLLFASVPVRGTFPEWKAACELASLPFTASELPEGRATIERVRGEEALDVTAIEESFVETYAAPIDFLRHLKRIGASTRLNGSVLSPPELNGVVRSWERCAGSRGTQVTYRVLFLALRNRGNGASPGERGS